MFCSIEGSRGTALFRPAVSGSSAGLKRVDSTGNSHEIGLSFFRVVDFNRNWRKGLA